MPPEKRVLLGAIAGAHGVRGEVRIRSFTAALGDIATYGPLSDEAGTRTFRIKVRGKVRGLAIAKIDGVADRNAAEALRGLRLYVPRRVLPKPGREQWYLADLEGLRVETAAGASLGRVKSVQNFGAGDLLEVEPTGGPAFWLPFTKRVVPVIDIDRGRLVVEVPGESEARPEDHDKSETTEAQRGRETGTEELKGRKTSR